MIVEPVLTARLRLPAATVEQLQAAIDRDRDRLAELLEASPPEPFVAPPETGDVLWYFRDAIEADPGLRPWFFRWIVDRQSALVIGSVGFAGRPDAGGAVFLGYSVYPEYAGKGYASEAATAMTEWALAQEAVEWVRATIFPGHLASQRVAARAGLRYSHDFETEDGIVQMWERPRTE